MRRFSKSPTYPKLLLALGGHETLLLLLGRLLLEALAHLGLLLFDLLLLSLGLLAGGKRFRRMKWRRGLS